MAFLDYDARAVEAKKDFELLPKGTYRAMLVKADVKESKKGTGGYLSTETQILEGPFKNRKLYDNLLIFHNDAQVRSWHEPRFNSLVLATAGAVQVSDTSELLSKPFLVKVGLSKPDKSTGDISNTIMNYYPDSPDFDAYAEPDVPFTQQAPTVAATPAPTAPAAQPAGAGAPPWAAR